MSLRLSHPATLAALMLAVVVPGHALAAQSYDNCTGFIDSLPTTISSPGTWCLRKDLSTAITEGRAIAIDADDVTVDCNHFKLGGLVAGPATKADGIRSFQVDHVTVRRCNVRGFSTGIDLTSGIGHRVEDNRLEGNTSTGINVRGYDATVARNLVRNTGGSTVFTGTATGIMAWNSVDITDNTVSGVDALPNAQGTRVINGIKSYEAEASRVAGNRVRGIPAAAQNAFVAGLSVQQADSLDVLGNEFIGPGQTAVTCSGPGTRVSDNIISGFTSAMNSCTDAGGNDITP
jgi:hypothetical protein